MKVHWTSKAIEHLLKIYEHIAADSLLYAEQLLDRIIVRSEQIEQFPYSGRAVPEYQAKDIRELIEGNYRIKAEQIDIVAVVHSARPLSPET